MNDSLLWSYSFKCCEKLRAGMTWRTPSRELRALYAMNNSELWLTRTSLSHELKALYAMNNSRFWVMSYSRLSAYSFWCYEELRVLEDMNELGSHELKPLYDEQLRVVDDMNDSWLWAMVLNSMKNIGLWMKWMTLGSEYKALDDTNNSRSWLTWTTLGHELNILDAMIAQECGWHEQL